MSVMLAENLARVDHDMGRYNCSHLVIIDGSARGARFLSEPLDNRGWELRCYLQDPDGYIIEVGQAGKKMLDFIEDLGG